MHRPAHFGRKIIAVMAIATITLSIMLSTLTSNAFSAGLEDSTNDNAIANYVCQTEENLDCALSEYLLGTEEDIQHYAYMKLDEADSSLHPVILQARNIIIHRFGWVADGVKGYVTDENGNIIEELPQFSDLFPVDWDVPIVTNNEVDLSYYGK